jgi:hypothetical protein
MDRFPRPAPDHTSSSTWPSPLDQISLRLCSPHPYTAGWNISHSKRSVQHRTLGIAEWDRPPHRSRLCQGCRPFSRLGLSARANQAPLVRWCCTHPTPPVQRLRSHVLAQGHRCLLVLLTPGRRPHHRGSYHGRPGVIRIGGLPERSHAFLLHGFLLGGVEPFVLVDGTPAMSPAVAFQVCIV